MNGLVYLFVVCLFHCVLDAKNLDRLLSVFSGPV